MPDLFIRRTAIISECGLYRYLLEHDFGGPGPVISLGMTNPADADEQKNDPTMTRVDGFCARLRASKVKVWNISALRNKHVRALRTAADPIGPENDFYIEQAIRDADIHIVAWGPLAKLPPNLRNRWRVAADILDRAGCRPMCWGTAKDGHPRHPLMVAYAAPLVPWIAPEAH